MAETANIGKLVVDMVLDPSRWKAGVEAVTAAAKLLVDGITRAADAVSGALSPAMDEAADGSEAAAKAMGETASAANATGAAIHDLAGVYVDASGKLRDASGKFVKDADVLRALGDTAGMTADQIKALQDRADKIRFEGASKASKALLADLQSVADFAQGALVRAFQVAAVAGGALLAASTAVGVDFEQKMRTVGVVAEASSDQLRQLTAEAERLGATTTFSASEAADAMGVLASAGLDTGQIMAGAGEALVLAGAGGVDLRLAASALASTLSQFNMVADDSGRVVDVLAKATAGSQFEIGDLAEALKYAGPTAASFGYSLEDAVAALAQFRDMGLQGSAAGTALRSVLSQASQQTKVNADALARYGLTLADVNPQLHSFGEILATVGSVQMAAADAMTVFGVESGGAFASMAEQMALGSTKLQEMQADLAGASGAAQDMYADMQQTVAGAFSELQGAGENVLLTLFDQYSSTLPALVQAVADFVNEAASAVEARSAEISGALAEAFQIVQDYLGTSGGDLADLFAAAVVEAANFAVTLAEVGVWFADLLPYVESLAKLLATIWAAQKVAAFASALSNVVALIGAAQTGLAAFAAELTVATGGTFALVAAVAALATGLGVLITQYTVAAREARDLKAAQQELAGKQASEDRARAAELAAILETQKAGIDAERERLASAGQLTAERKKELDLLEGLSGVDAARLEAQGKLVEVGGQLRSTAAVVSDMDEAGYAAIQDRVAALNAESASANARILELSEGLKAAKAMAERTNMATALAGLSAGAKEDFASIQAVGAAITDLGRRRDAAEAEALALTKERVKAEEKLKADEAQADKDRYRADVVANAGSARDKLATEKDLTLALRNLREGIADESAALDTALTDALAAEQSKRRRQIETEAQHRIESAKGDVSKIAAIKAEETAALADLEKLYERKRAGERAEAEREAAAKVKSERERLISEIYALEHGSDQKTVKESERLAQEKADALRGISSENFDLMLELAAAYDAKIAAAREKEEAEEKAKGDARIQREKERWRRFAGFAKDAADAFRDVVGAVTAAVTAAFSALEGYAGQIYELFQTLTGWDFSLSGTVDDVLTAQETATEEGTTLSTADAVAQVMAETFAGAATTLAAFVEAAPLILDALVAGLPTLINAFVAALPTIVDAVVAAIPLVVGQVAAALPGLVAVFVAVLPGIIDALLDAAMTVIQAVLAQIPVIIPALIDAVLQVVTFLSENLDLIVAPLLDAALVFVQAILAALPTLLPELIGIAVDLVLAVVEALPTFVTAILGALPEIITSVITALVEAIPEIIDALIVAIPDIIAAIIIALPGIFIALMDGMAQIFIAIFAKIPDIIVGLVKGMGTVATALITAIGEGFAAGAEWIGDLGSQIWEGLKNFFTLDNLSELAEAFGDAFVQGIKNAADAILDAIVDIFTAAWDWVVGLFSGDSKGRSASFTGGDQAGMLGALAGAAFSDLLAGPGAVTREAGGGESGRADRRAPPGMTAWTSVTLNLDGQAIQESLVKNDRGGRPTVVSTSRIGHAGPAVGMSRGRFERYGR